MADDEDEDHKPREVPLGTIPEHYSAVRYMWARGHHEDYQAFTGLAAARQNPDAVLIMEADSGGQILVTCPVVHVRASEEVLYQLLCDLENICWGPGGLDDAAAAYDARTYYEALPIGSEVGGGMGGGLVTDGVWVHRELDKLGLRRQIEEIVGGMRMRLSEEGDARLHRRRF